MVRQLISLTNERNKFYRILLMIIWVFLFRSLKDESYILAYSISTKDSYSSWLKMSQNIDNFTAHPTAARVQYFFYWLENNKHGSKIRCEIKIPSRLKSSSPIKEFWREESINTKLRCRVGSSSFNAFLIRWLFWILMRDNLLIFNQWPKVM